MELIEAWRDVAVRDGFRARTFAEPDFGGNRPVDGRSASP